jgi:protein arginine kinase activator
MKCEKCNEKEANFFYTVTINGETTQYRLCADCARELGLDGALSFSPMASVFGGLFREPASIFDSLMSPSGFMLPVMTVTSPFFEGSPLSAAPPAAPPAEKSAENIPADAGAEIKAKRELTALKSQLESAVKAEDFEKAVELRDKIKSAENK